MLSLEDIVFIAAVVTGCLFEIVYVGLNFFVCKKHTRVIWEEQQRERESFLNVEGA